MNPKQLTRSAATWAAAGIGFATASYATYVAITWLRYGRPKPACGKGADALLDTFMSNYEVVDRHKIFVAAPAEIALSAATEMNLESCAVVRGLFKTREFILRSKPDNTIRPRGLLAEAKSLGWAILAERPSREIVFGALTRPWEANPVFTALAPHEFASFDDPGNVKIAWTLRADPVGNGKTIFRTETRALATDPEARKKFRRYWSFLSPGIIAIRRVMLPAIKTEAEQRWRAIAA